VILRQDFKCASLQTRCLGPTRFPCSSRSIKTVTTPTEVQPCYQDGMLDGAHPHPHRRPPTRPGAATMMKMRDSVEQRSEKQNVSRESVSGCFPRDTTAAATPLKYSREQQRIMIVQIDDRTTVVAPRRRDEDETGQRTRCNTKKDRTFEKFHQKIHVSKSQRSHV